MNNKTIGDNYEYYVLDKLKETHNMIWLWKNVPEKILFDHNIILDYNEYCESRKDIGIDIVGLKDDKLYFYQCKNYQDSVMLDKLAGMMFFCISRSVDVNVCYSNNISKFIIKTIDVWRDKMTLKINLMHIPYNNNEIENEKKHKNILQPRQYQIDAVNTLTNFHRGLLATPCGTGKTYTSSLIAKKYKHIIIFAPLRELASNLLNTYNKYLGNTYNTILVSSDTAGTRDHEIIINSLKNKNIIASTYASADIIIKILDRLADPLIIIDEYHNLSNTQLTDTTNDMNKILSSNENILFLSATPTNKIKFDKTYKMEWNTAVQNKLIHDFNMIIPNNQIIDDNKLDIFISTLEDIGEINDKKRILIKQAYFLLRSLKYNGNKKCIAFFTTINTTIKFKSIIMQLAALCNIDLNAEIIVSDTTHKQRAERIKIFKESKELAILLSVHILDEGIDIPESDSVFVTRPDDDIDNLIQRLSRCNRMLDGKLNVHMYLWCGYQKIKGILGQINKKFICKIPEKISIINIGSNKMMIKPTDKNTLKKVIGINNINYTTNCIFDNDDLLFNTKNLSEIFDINVLNNYKIKKNSTNNVIINGYEPNKIIIRDNNTYISVVGIHELIKEIYVTISYDIKIKIINILLEIMTNYGAYKSVVKFLNIMERSNICIDFNIIEKLLNIKDDKPKKDTLDRFKKNIDYIIDHVNNKTMVTIIIFEYLCAITMTQRAAKMRDQILKIGTQTCPSTEKILINNKTKNYGTCMDLYDYLPKHIDFDIDDKFIEEFYAIQKNKSKYNIDLDIVADWLGANIDNLIQTLKSGYRENEDYVVKLNAKPKKKDIGGSEKKSYFITSICFKLIAFRSNAKNGNKIRRCYITLEEIANNHKDEILEFYKHNQITKKRTTNEFK